MNTLNFGDEYTRDMALAGIIGREVLTKPRVKIIIFGGHEEEVVQLLGICRGGRELKDFAEKTLKLETVYQNGASVRGVPAVRSDAVVRMRGRSVDMIFIVNREFLTWPERAILLGSCSAASIFFTTSVRAGESHVGRA